MKVYKVFMDSEPILASIDRQTAIAKFRQAVEFCRKFNRQGSCVELYRKGQNMPERIVIV